MTWLLGKHFADLTALVTHYLPKSAIDPITSRMIDLLDRRGERGGAEETPNAAASGGGDGDAR